MGGGALRSSGAVRRLVYHAGALGDFITSLPAVAAWRGSDRAVLLGRPAYAELADPPFDDVWDAAGARFAALFAPSGGSRAADAPLFAGIGSALIFAAASSPLADNLRALGVSRVDRHDPLPARAMPIVDYHLAAIGAANAAGATPRIRCAAAPPVEVPDPVVAIAPGSGSAKKNWPLEAFVELCGLLQHSGFGTVWVIGPAEDSLRIPMGAHAWKELALAGLAAAFARCRLFVGNDSGVTHLAAACGCPTIALFGATDPGVWAPRGRAVRVVNSRTGTMNDVSVHEVFAACRDLLVLEERRRTGVRWRGEL
jgi:heptosyltransferase-3